jgi:hypothetical protein
MGLSINTLLDSNEGTTIQITGTLLDENGDAVADGNINKVTIAIYDYNTETVIRAEDELSPSSGVVTTWLTKDEVRIINTALEYEYRHIVMVADYGGTKRVVEEAYVKIDNVGNYVVSA